MILMCRKVGKKRKKNGEYAIDKCGLCIFFEGDEDLEIICPEGIFFFLRKVVLESNM